MELSTTVVVFVCSGNICRSPLAQAMAAAALRDAGVDARVISSGIAALSGQPAERGARDEAAGLGLSLDEHRAQGVTRELIDTATLVVGVTDRHRDHLRQFFPKERAKIVSFDDVTGLGDIADPYGGGRSDYRMLREQLEEGMPKIIGAVKSRLKAAAPRERN